MVGEAAAGAMLLRGGFGGGGSECEGLDSDVGGSSIDLAVAEGCTTDAGMSAFVDFSSLSRCISSWREASRLWLNERMPSMTPLSMAASDQENNEPAGRGTGPNCQLPLHSLTYL